MRNYTYAVEDITVCATTRGPTNTSCPVGTPENEDKKMKRWSDSSRKQLEARQRVGYD